MDSGTPGPGRQALEVASLLAFTDPSLRFGKCLDILSPGDQVSASARSAVAQVIAGEPISKSVTGHLGILGPYLEYSFHLGTS